MILHCFTSTDIKISQFRGRSNRYIDCLFIRYVHKYRYSSVRGAREVGGSLFIRYVHKYRYSSVRGAREVGGSLFIRYVHKYRYSSGRGAREVGGSLFIRYVHKYRYSSVRGAREVGGSLFIRYVHKYRYSSGRGAREVAAVCSFVTSISTGIPVLEVLARLAAAEKFLTASALRRSRNRLARSAPDIGVPVCGP
ncbi:uncharacterized protein TNCV_929161 [Trichonephila clavipes]|nr:uncharacterized protein TNCV_929161 [Trichonephila clavipes]